MFVKVSKSFNNLENINIIDAINLKEEIFSNKEEVQNILEYISLIFFEKLKEKNQRKYAECIELMENTKERLRKNNNFDMTIDRMLITAWEILQS
ncbi:MAG: hypothetical protein FWC79_01670 [Oscillospiraceae bacterium]|nr:hypothetical protein [Oscillospiraceae bacterium]